MPVRNMIVYMTHNDREAAEQIGRSLVTKKLAACVNLIEGMTSIYEWNGETAVDKEIVVIAKTREDRVGDVIEYVTKVHPYDVPCVVAWPIEAGHPPFLEWIAQQSASQ